jgi:signal transduction histidine kinase
VLENLEIFSVGAAAVLDTVLVLVLLEARGSRRAVLPALALVLGVWLWHAGAFGHLLLSDATGRIGEEARRLTLLAAAGGLLLIPGALLHGALRLREIQRPRAPRLRGIKIAAYLPLAFIIPAASGLSTGPQRALVPLPEAWLAPYVLWFAAVASYSVFRLFRLGRTLAEPRAASFCGVMGATLASVAAIIAVLHFVAVPAWPGARRHLHLAALLLPVFPAAIFAFHVIHHNFLGLMLERTLVYAALVIGALLFHRLVFGDVTSALESRYSLDFGIIEGAIVILLILAYQPLRRRCAEALRYLFGAGVREERNRIRALAVQMSSLAGQPPEDILGWFVDSLQPILGVDRSAGWLLGPGGEVIARRGQIPDIPEEWIPGAYRELGERRYSSKLDPAGPRTMACAWRADASILLELPEPTPGLILLGRRSGNREYSGEEVNSLLLLVEQLASTMLSSRLQAERLLAERRAFEREKLSTLGLLASSIAHEVKNPLSSIKTIATVLCEDLGDGNERTRDLRVIAGEADRLARRTSELLEFARPGRQGAGPASLGEVIGKTLGVLGHLARQHGVEVDCRLDDGTPPVRADEASLTEIVFNLLLNSLEAARSAEPSGKSPKRRVEVMLRRQDGHAVLELRDNGPGIPPEVQDRIFEPFFSTKEDGTGLGLYIVSRRVRELAGEIHCESAPDRGTTFTVKLPLERSS